MDSSKIPEVKSTTISYKEKRNFKSAKKWSHMKAILFIYIVIPLYQILY